MPSWIVEKGVWVPEEPLVEPPGGGDDGGGGAGPAGGSVAGYCFYLAATPADGTHEEIPSAHTALFPWTELWIPLAGAVFARACTSIWNGLAPAGSRFGFEYWNTATSAWESMGATIPVDVGMDDATTDEAIRGAWVPLTFGATGDVKVRMYREGGDDDTRVLHGECYLEVAYGTPPSTPPDNPCDNLYAPNFGDFADFAAFLAATGATVDDPEAAFAIDLDSTHVLIGTKAIHAVPTGAVPAAFPYNATITIPLAGAPPSTSVGVAASGFTTGLPLLPDVIADIWMAAFTTVAADATGAYSVVLRFTMLADPTGSTTQTWLDGLTTSPECAGGAPPGVVPDPVPATGGAFGIMTFPPDPDFISPWNAGMLSVTPGNIIAQLNSALAAGHKVLINVNMAPNSDIGGHNNFNFNAYRDTIAGFSGIDLSPYASILLGVYTMDDVRVASRWGAPIPDATLDEIARLWKVALPGILTYLRLDAVSMESNNFNWQYTDGAISQFTAARGPIGSYITKQQAAANRQGLRNMFSLNILNGGDGSSGILGTSNQGPTGEGRWEMTAAELLNYGLPMIAAGGDALFMWRYRSSYPGRAGVAAALNQLAAAVSAAA